MRERNYFHSTQNITIWGLGGAKLSEVLSLTPTSLLLLFHLLPPKTLLAFIILRAFWVLCSWVCMYMCVSGRKTPLIRCHVVLEAVICQGSSRYLSVTTSLFSVCGWFGTVHLNTHICCSSMTWTTERSAIKMTLIVKHNRIQSCFRRFLTLGLDGQKSESNFSTKLPTKKKKKSLGIYNNYRKSNTFGVYLYSMMLPDKEKVNFWSTAPALTISKL